MNCYIHGSFMNDNFGDFLLYDLTVSACAEVVDESNIISSNIDNSYDCRTIVHRRGKFNAIKNSEVAVITGGGYFGEINKKIYKHYWNLRFIFRHGLPLAYLAKSKKNYIIIGLGVGPLTWKPSKKLATYILNNADKVILRDIESFEYAKNILNVSRKIDVYPDMVMGCNMQKYLTENNWAESELMNTKHHLAVHLTTRNKHNGAGIDIVLNDLIKFVKENGDKWGIYIICDQSGSRRIKRAKKIYNELLKVQRDVKVFSYEGPEKLCSLLSHMDVILTDKLHVGIVGTKLGKYVVSAASHKKTKRFYDQIKRED